jgi:peptidoglycan hydrolase-like protein with peptidoglycan-binding domain
MKDSIKHPVGEGGSNRKDDVAIVQQLLNRARVKNNVPQEPLDVDGIVGPKTLAAIREFQTQFCSVVDGRVDPENETINQLRKVAGHVPDLNDGISYLTPKVPPNLLG